MYKDIEDIIMGIYGFYMYAIMAYMVMVPKTFFDNETTFSI